MKQTTLCMLTIMNAMKNKPFFSHRFTCAIAILLFVSIGVCSMAQSTVIEGVVRNADTKELLPYVLLRIAGTNTGAQANSEG